MTTEVVRAPGRHRLAGLVGAALAAGMWWLATQHSISYLAPLAFGLFAVQLVFAQAWLAALDAKGSGGALLIGVAVSGVADALLVRDSHLGIEDFAPIMGSAVVASILHQLYRRPRPGVVPSITATVSLAAIELCGASYLGLHRMVPGSGNVVAVSLLGLGAALAAARLVDFGLRWPRLSKRSSRGIPGLVAGLAAAGAVGRWWGMHHLHADGASIGMRLALVSAVIALAVDLAVDLAASDPEIGDRSFSALTPLTALLPIVMAGPGIYAAARHLLG